MLNYSEDMDNNAKEESLRALPYESCSTSRTMRNRDHSGEPQRRRERQVWKNE